MRAFTTRPGRAAVAAPRADRPAREELIRRHLPLAERLATRYRNPHEPLEDLVQVARLALIGAVDRFDHRTRASRSPPSRCPPMIGELKKHFRDTAWALHVPRAAAERAQAVAAGLRPARRAPRPQSERSTELAAFLVDRRRGPRWRRWRRRVARYAVSLNAPVGRRGVQEPAELVELLGSRPTTASISSTPGWSLADGPARPCPFQERRALHAARRAPADPGRDRCASSAARRCRSHGCLRVRHRRCAAAWTPIPAREAGVASTA